MFANGVTQTTNTVVFLHGLFGTQNEFIPYKVITRGKVEVFTYDLPHHGTRNDLQPFSLPDLLTDLEKQLQGAGIQQACFVGHSLGGLLALQYAAMHPDSVRAVCLLDIFPQSTPQFQNFQAELLTLLQEWDAAQMPLPTAQIWRSENGCYLLKYFKRRGGKMNADTCEQFIHFIRNDLPLLLLPKPLPLPLMLIKGTCSALTKTLQESEILRTYPQIRIESIPGAAHLLHITHRKEIVSLIQNFIDAVLTK